MELYLQSAAVILVCLIFQRIYPSTQNQKFLRPELSLDVIYLVLGSLVIGQLAISIVNTIVILGDLGDIAERLSVEIAPYDNVLNVITCLILVDFVAYWYHFIFHKGTLWKFHATHHSSKTLDWLSASRFHPIENVFNIAIQTIVAVLIFKFNIYTFAAASGIRSLYGYFVHSNISWTFGPLGYVFASPYFHRWHHTMEKEGWDKNFGGVFSAWDFIFGTAYWPKNKQPHNFGVPDKLGNTLWSQFKYPFIKSA